MTCVFLHILPSLGFALWFSDHRQRTLLQTLWKLSPASCIVWWTTTPQSSLLRSTYRMLRLCSLELREEFGLPDAVNYPIQFSRWRFATGNLASCLLYWGWVPKHHLKGFSLPQNTMAQTICFIHDVNMAPDTDCGFTLKMGPLKALLTQCGWW